MGRTARSAQRARLTEWQGNVNVLSGALRVRGDDGRDVAVDAQTLGEVQIRANDVMLGYYRDPEATAKAFTPDGWFRTCDVAVIHPDSYFKLRDRAKDVIISGGENITSVELEQAIASHPAVSEGAVMAAPTSTGARDPRGLRRVAGRSRRLRGRHPRPCPRAPGGFKVPPTG